VRGVKRLAASRSRCTRDFVRVTTGSVSRINGNVVSDLILVYERIPSPPPRRPPRSIQPSSILLLGSRAYIVYPRDAGDPAFPVFTCHLDDDRDEGTTRTPGAYPLVLDGARASQTSSWTSLLACASRSAKDISILIADKFNPRRGRERERERERVTRDAESHRRARRLAETRCLPAAPL